MSNVVREEKLPKYAKHLTPTELADYQRLQTERANLNRELWSVNHQRDLLRRRAYQRMRHGYAAVDNPRSKPILIPYAGKEP